MIPARLVADDSVVVKWFLRDEDLLTEADQLLADWRATETEVVTPHHMPFEVVHAISRANRRQRLSATAAERAIEDFSAIVEEFTFAALPAAAGVAGGADVAIRYGVNFYDACYFYLARSASIPLLTADEAFFRQMSAEPGVLWLGDYAADT